MGSHSNDDRKNRRQFKFWSQRNRSCSRSCTYVEYNFKFCVFSFYYYLASTWILDWNNKQEEEENKRKWMKSDMMIIWIKRIICAVCDWTKWKNNNTSNSETIFGLTSQLDFIGLFKRRAYSAKWCSHGMMMMIPAIITWAIIIWETMNRYRIRAAWAKPN